MTSESEVERGPRYRARSTALIAIPLSPPFSITVPVTLTFFSINGISLLF